MDFHCLGAHFDFVDELFNHLPQIIRFDINAYEFSVVAGEVFKLMRTIELSWPFGQSILSEIERSYLINP